MTHATDIGYELQSSLLVMPRMANPDVFQATQERRASVGKLGTGNWASHLATFNRILIATQACVMAWCLMSAQGEDAAATREFLVCLSGRQMERAWPVTFPALFVACSHYLRCLTHSNIIPFPISRNSHTLQKISSIFKVSRNLCRYLCL